MRLQTDHLSTLKKPPSQQTGQPHKVIHILVWPVLYAGRVWGGGLKQAAGSIDRPCWDATYNSSPNMQFRC